MRTLTRLAALTLALLPTPALLGMTVYENRPYGPGTVYEVQPATAIITPAQVYTVPATVTYGYGGTTYEPARIVATVPQITVQQPAHYGQAIQQTTYTPVGSSTVVVSAPQPVYYAPQQVYVPPPVYAYPSPSTVTVFAPACPQPVYVQPRRSHAPALGAGLTLGLGLRVGAEIGCHRRW